MEQVIKYIKLGLENVEVINIDVEDIEYVFIHGISDHDVIYRSGEMKYYRRKYCQKLSVCINKNANKKYLSYGKPSSLTIFERLSNFDDIVDITYLDENENEIESINVPWKYKHFDKSAIDDNNLNQSSQIDEDGNLKIVIEGDNESW